MVREWIEAYAAGAALVSDSIAGLTSVELHARPVPGTWSIQEIVIHLMDSDLIGADRMKRIIAEERPTLMAYNESAFAARLRYDKLDANTAAEVFRLNRRLTTVILRDLPDDDFQRVGVHSEDGEVTLAQQVKKYADHLNHHLVHLRAKREILGKPFSCGAR